MRIACLRAILWVVAVFLSSNVLASEVKTTFWSEQKKGANSFNNVPLDERFKAAKAAGLDFLRIAPNKWLNGREKEELGDFLLGRPGSFQNLIEEDVDYLVKVLDKAEASGIKIVLTVLSLPGNRWRQHNAGVQEREIWSDLKYHRLAARFWAQLAERLKGHPAIVAYNIKNEPSPEFGPVMFADWYSGDYEKWYQSVRGTAQDLNLFYRTVIRAIREKDQYTPIMIDSGFYSTPWAFKVLEPVDDPYILYSFHMYEPYAYVNHRNVGQYEYPGSIPTGESNASSREWNESTLSQFFDPVREWAEKHNIPKEKIICGEFGIYRLQSQAHRYLDDQMKIYNQEGWHWAFYSFREDDWAGMDYELGSAKPGWPYWQAIEKNQMPGPKTYQRDSPLWNTIKKRLEQEAGA